MHQSVVDFLREIKENTELDHFQMAPENQCWLLEQFCRHQQIDACNYQKILKHLAEAGIRTRLLARRFRHYVGSLGEIRSILERPHSPEALKRIPLPKTEQGKELMQHVAWEYLRERYSKLPKLGWKNYENVENEEKEMQKIGTNGKWRTELINEIRKKLAKNQREKFGTCEPPKRIRQTLEQQLEHAKLYEARMPRFVEAARKFQIEAEKGKAGGFRILNRRPFDQEFLEGIHALYQHAHLTPKFIMKRYKVHPDILAHELDARGVQLYARWSVGQADGGFLKVRQLLNEHLHQRELI